MTATIEYYKSQLIKYLYDEKNKGQITNILIQAEEKTQIKREYIALVSIGILSLYLVFGYGAQLLCNVIGFVYPAYCSIKALESKHKEDDTRWLTYWVVFAVFSVFEFFSDLLLSWFPLYWLVKCIFLIWCFLPVTWNGSDVIYNHVVRPFFMKHQTNIDSAMGKVTNRINEIADEASKVASDALKKD